MEHFTAQPQEPKADDIGMNTGTPYGADSGPTTPVVIVEQASDTPRTDAAVLLGFAETADLCERLERELNHADSMIQALIKHGDLMAKRCESYGLKTAWDVVTVTLRSKA